MSGNIRYMMMTLVVALCLFVGTEAFAKDKKGKGVTIGNSITVNGGVRADVDSDTDEFAVDNSRLAFGVDTSYGISADVAVQYDGTSTNDVDILDAVISVDVPTFDFVSGVKAGRFLAPQDRAGLNDVYGQIAWDGPTVVQKYPSVNGYGRLNGAEVYGSVSTVNYLFGVFEGVETNNALIAGRLDTEIEGVNLGFAFQTQNDADLSGSSDFFGWNLDAAFSRNVDKVGTVDLSGGFFKYDLDGAHYVPGIGINEGLGGYVTGAVTLNNTLGKRVTPQPFVRYQNFQFDGSQDGEQERWDAGVNLIFDEKTNTKLTVSYFNDELLGVTSDGVLAGIQFAF